ncbi:hypothetical protein [Desulfosarcina cetonica]
MEKLVPENLTFSEVNHLPTAITSCSMKSKQLPNPPGEDLPKENHARRSIMNIISMS